MDKSFHEWIDTIKLKKDEDRGKTTTGEATEKMAQFVDKIIRDYFWENGPRTIQGFDDLTDNEVKNIL